VNESVTASARTVETDHESDIVQEVLGKRPSLDRDVDCPPDFVQRCSRGVYLWRVTVIARHEAVLLNLSVDFVHDASTRLRSRSDNVKVRAPSIGALADRVRKSIQECQVVVVDLLEMSLISAGPECRSYD